MIVSYNDDLLIIFDNNNKLKSKHKFQIEYWGFSYEKEKYFLEINSVNIFYIQQLVDYLKSQNINFQLSDHILNELNEFNNQIQAYNNKKGIARDFKNGIFNVERFSDFSNFIK